MDNAPEPFAFICARLERVGPIPCESEADRKGYRYLDAGHISSFDLMPFILEIEDTFDIVLTPEDTQSDAFRTVGGLADIIARRRAARD